ncbi:glycosyltransferase family 4 protein [Paenibacillus cellulositrophicus]|uniref:glycosyltransferase family 4 protein n=1 Tax=Paenibacillus cellulositrophicus TaxID=562959 RepID=UPI0020418C6F|nr:glycosyltransferase family 1 protein [Paenibacillus cellulositrophicus]MCM2996922.1 glycosyltransferase family 4 protein [Paenibacillus cellulositrophicus]
MRIGIDATYATSRIGGVGTYTINLIKSLLDVDNQIEIIGFILKTDTWEDTELPPFSNRLKYHYEEKKFNISGEELIDDWNQVLLPELLDRYEIDIFLGPSFIIPINWKGPSIVTIHDRFFEMDIPKLPTPYINKWARICAEKAKAIITVSKYTSIDIVDNWDIPKELVYPIHLAPALTYTPTNKEYSSKKIQEALDINKPFILHVGGWHPRKNLIKVLIALSLLDAIRLNEICLVATCQNNRLGEMLLKRLGIENNVLFIGYTSPDVLPDLYAAAKVLVYPSTIEGFGLPLVESMSCGTPVITSRCGAIPEVVGDNALFVDPNDEHQIKKAIEKIIADQDLYYQLMKLGKEYSRQFSWQKTATETINLFRRVLSQS